VSDYFTVIRQWPRGADGNIQPGSEKLSKESLFL